MPAKPGRDEQVFVRLFVSAYENFAWVGSRIDPLDEQLDGAIEALITRADGETMAIEHTLIQPFLNEMTDLTRFEPVFRRIADDESLAVPYTGITVYVPVGILDGHKRATQGVIAEAIHSWIADNRLHLREGEYRYQCDIPGMSPVTLTVKRNKYNLSQGVVLLGRQQVINDLDKVIEKALLTKLPKLIRQQADRHVLFLERNRFNFFPELIFAEIERQRPNFPLLEKVDEIWHVETIFYKQDGYVYFELPKGDKLLETFTFQNDVLVERSKDGMPYPM
jgi:hypothetical protein